MVEVNWASRSDVSMSEKLNLEIPPLIKASAQEVVDVHWEWPLPSELTGPQW